MGLFNSFSNSLNRGVNTVSRSGKTAQLNMQLNELMKQRQGLVAQLGASLYEVTKNDPRYTVGREALYQGIASIDAQRANIEAQIGQLRAEQAAQTAASQTYRCPNCGSAVAATDLFCSGCGLPIAQVMAMQPQYTHQASSQQQTLSSASFQKQPAYGIASSAAQPPAPSAPTAKGRVCPNCGASMGDDDLFCMNCGTRVPVQASEAPTTTDAPEAPAPSLAPQPPEIAESAAAAEKAPVTEPSAPISSDKDSAAASPVVQGASATDNFVATSASSSSTPAEASTESASVPNGADDARALSDALESLDKMPIPEADAFESDVTKVMNRTPRTVSSPSGHGVSPSQFVPSAAPMPAPTAAPIVPPASVPFSAVRRCPNCGAEVGPTEKFCFSCGSKLS